MTDEFGQIMGAMGVSFGEHNMLVIVCSDFLVVADSIGLLAAFECVVFSH